MAKEVVACLLAILFVNLTIAQDYCNIQSCRGKPHTACTYKSSAPSANCGKTIGSGLSQDEKQRIVKLHNQLRQKVAKGGESRGSNGPQPAAKNMANLEWDNELEKIAQRWASQCNFAHDKCRNVERYPVGQNLAIGWTTGDVNSFKVEKFVNDWYDEVTHFDNRQVSSFTGSSASGKAIGHYTQLVWAKSTKIGCGAMKYVDQGMNTFYLVCNYGQAGNYLGQAVYQV